MSDSFRDYQRSDGELRPTGDGDPAHQYAPVADRPALPAFDGFLGRLINGGETDWSYGEHCNIERMWQWLSGMNDEVVRVHETGWSRAARLLSVAASTLRQREQALRQAWQGEAASVFVGQVWLTLDSIEKWKTVADDNARAVGNVAEETSLAQFALGGLHEEYLTARDGALAQAPTTGGTPEEMPSVSETMEEVRREYHNRAVEITRKVADAYVNAQYYLLDQGEVFAGPRVVDASSSGGGPGGVAPPGAPGPTASPAGGAPVPSFDQVPAPAPVPGAPPVNTSVNVGVTPGLGGYLAGLTAPVAPPPAPPPPAPQPSLPGSLPAPGALPPPVPALGTPGGPSRAAGRGAAGGGRTVGPLARPVAPGTGPGGRGAGVGGRPGGPALPGTTGRPVVAQPGAAGSTAGSARPGGPGRAGGPVPGARPGPPALRGAAPLPPGTAPSGTRSAAGQSPSGARSAPGKSGAAPAPGKAPPGSAPVGRPADLRGATATAGARSQPPGKNDRKRRRTAGADDSLWAVPQPTGLIESEEAAPPPEHGQPIAPGGSTPPRPETAT